MSNKTLSRSFAAGEISPLLYARLDLDKFQTGVALALNMETLPQGPAQNRSGFGYVLEAKDSSRPVVLLPFSYSTQQTFVLEFGHKYVRFHGFGGTLMELPVTLNNVTNEANPVFTTISAHNYAVGDWIQIGFAGGMPLLTGRWAKISSVPAANKFTLVDLFGNAISTVGMPLTEGTGSVSRVYEIATPYDSADLGTLHYVQSADVLTLVSPLYLPMELRRLAATNWQLVNIQFASSLSPPQSNGAIPSAITHTYRVVPIMQSAPGLPSAGASCSNDLTIPGRFNAIGWTSVSGAIGYYVYKLLSGTWTFIGISISSPSFIDDSSVVPNPSVPQFSAPGPTTTVTATAVAPASTGVSVTPTGGGAISYSYRVTSVAADDSEESIASGTVTVSNDLNVAGNFNTIQWPAVPGVTNYNVYRSLNGIYGFIGRAGSDCTFVDRNIAPDARTTPPIQVNPFLGAGNYPQAVTYHQQRRAFGGTLNAPQTVWMTRSGTEKNIGYSEPSRDDDSVIFRLVAREANTVRHMVPMGELILLTSGGEWQASSSDTGALTPSSVSVKPQGYSGASNVQPVVTDRTILFAQDRGGAIRELEFSWQQQGYQTSNVSIIAHHLFDYYTVVQMAFTRSPIPSLWSVRSDGVLLGMTYVPQQEIKAWHQHTTDGAFESVCVVAEGDEDVVYAVVRRQILGITKRYVERKHTRRFDTPADQFFVDSGLSYVGPEVSAVGGLYHLEGKTVSILADGGVSPPQVVVNGSVKLDAPASKVQVGLPYVSRLQGLPLSISTMQALGQGTVKNINKAYLRVYYSSGFKAGPSFDKLRQFPTRSSEPYGSPPELVTGEVPLTIDPQWQSDGTWCIEQSDPVSLTLLGLTLDVTTGS
ncbi:hypothetical protein EJP67_18615 [Variovorax guangxiensis]|uniref:Ubiquitin-activating enzyme E1 FCCH domain-containing protein n=1 Tax=Variovorax guangxiensis TaxID=1775474 RepID=A0A3S1F2D6_9BURK|nr:hypothetical protein [Variovorax guangxiensis]RUR69074.1 hypothetical protein EJP67_18615 [Variovorax guangxiensis]